MTAEILCCIFVRGQNLNGRLHYSGESTNNRRKGEVKVRKISNTPCMEANTIGNKSSTRQVANTPVQKPPNCVYQKTQNWPWCTYKYLIPLCATITKLRYGVDRMIKTHNGNIINQVENPVGVLTIAIAENNFAKPSFISRLPIT